MTPDHMGSQAPKDYEALLGSLAFPARLVFQGYRDMMVPSAHMVYPVVMEPREIEAILEDLAIPDQLVLRVLLGIQGSRVTQVR